MPSSINSQTNGVSHHGEVKKPISRLVLCLDGTGNLYSGSTSDTNIVKLYQKLDRKSKNQFHYYQPGIGTYATGEQSVNTTGLWAGFKRTVSQTLDQGIGTTFDSHVIAAYRFIMRYYEDGDKIYLFGFSRGAFTARFLARMINRIGLLSRGNEEMVPFAYKSYQDYVNDVLKINKAIKPDDWMTNFKETFCRDGVGIYFLGLFDTVNSVGYFDLPFTKKTILQPNSHRTAQYIRHAVAIDERRCKFKPALLNQDLTDSTEKIKEVYFPGNHGDIGGGWPAKGKQDQGEENDPVQLSDIPLNWMIEELKNLPYKDPEERLVFNTHVGTFVENFDRKKDEAITAEIHDLLRFGGGASWFKVILWNFLEHIPFFSRLELKKEKWVPTTFPPNRGDTRDIPKGANFHESVKERHDLLRHSKNKYEPKNKGIIKFHDGTNAR